MVQPGERGPASMDRVERLFVTMAITGFIVMTVAVVWMVIN